MTQLEVLGAIIEHIRETSIGEEHFGIGGSNLGDEVEHARKSRPPSSPKFLETPKFSETLGS